MAFRKTGISRSACGWFLGLAFAGWCCVVECAAQTTADAGATAESPFSDNPFRPPVRVAERPDAARGAFPIDLSTGRGLTRTPPAAALDPLSVPQAAPTAAVNRELLHLADTSGTPLLTKEHITRHIEQVNQAIELDEASRADLTNRLQKVREALQRADEAAAKVAQYTVEIQQSPQLAKDLKAILSQPQAEPVLEAIRDGQLVNLEQQLSQAEARLNEAKAEFVKREAELKRRPERQATLTKQIAATAEALDAAQKQRAAPAAANEKPIVTQVRQVELQAALIELQRQLEAFKLEVQRMDATTELLPLQRDLAKRNEVFAEKEVAGWQKIVADERKAESRRHAEEARRQLENAHPSLRQLAERNAELAEKRKAIAASIEKVSTEAQLLNKQLGQLKGDFDKLQEKVQIAGLSKTIGILLRKQRADLQISSAPRDWLRFIEREMPAAQLTLIELEDERSPLGEGEAAVRDVVTGLAVSLPESDRAMLEQTATGLLMSKRELLDKSIYDYNAYLKELGELELSCRRLITETTAYAEFIDKHVLWIRSAEPISLHDLRRAAGSLTACLNVQLWWSMAQQAYAGMAQRPAPGALGLVLILTLIFLRRRMFNRLDLLCASDSGTHALNFLTTLEAIGLAIVAATVWPSLMWCTGWWLQSSYDATAFSMAIAAGLQRGAVFLWLFQLIRISARPNGIGENHFGWYASSTKTLRENLLWLGTFGIPVAVAVTVLEGWDDWQGSDSLGRLVFLFGMIVTATAMHNVFRRQKGMLQEALARSPSGWLNRVRIVSYLAGTGLPCALAVLAAAGYYFSARQLAIRFELTMLIAISLVLMHGVVTRWFLVKRRNIAIRQARERRNSQAETNAENKVAAPVTMPAQDMTKIQSQLQYLLRYGATLAVLVVVWLVWSDVLPALRIFDRVVLWTSRAAVIEHITGADGQIYPRTVEQDVPTTLTHGLLALFIAAGTCVLGKNLPALLEITILERLPIDHGGRHALSIIVRYLLYVSGMLLVCRSLSVSWTSVQWLAAAMTVGLGFGLQEIFANLVSGLIILFERPIRVGDMVTVNGVTGTVSRMQIRATTITDFDRREMIVPNKKFITEDVINWTLSDPISRVTIEVGIAYGSDTGLAHSILTRAATEHPLVLQDPAPMALFRKFGESTLDFQLHVFLPNRSVFVTVVHELHSRIDREFREAGIEIAFPQRDVNIRSLNSELLPLMASGGQFKAA